MDTRAERWQSEIKSYENLIKSYPVGAHEFTQDVGCGNFNITKEMHPRWNRRIAARRRWIEAVKE